MAEKSIGDRMHDLWVARRTGELAKVGRFVLFYSAFTIAGVAGFALQAADYAQSLKMFATFCAVMTCLAALGGAAGFLFGIPRLAAKRIVAKAEASDSRPAAEAAVSDRLFDSNSNLEDLSDWLTKIIVGVGLIQLNAITANLNAFGAQFQDMFRDIAGVGLVACLTAVTAFAVGFLYVYLLTRTEGLYLFTQSVRAAERRDEGFFADGIQYSGDIFATPIEKLPDLETTGLTSADRRLLDRGRDALATAEDYAAWALAKAREGDLTSAEAAWLAAISRDTENRSIYRRRLAEIRFVQSRPREAFAALKDGINLATNGEEKEALMRDALLIALYLPPPQGFIEAKALAAALLASPKFSDDAMVHLWAAAAIGQQAQQLRNAPGGATADLGELRDEALKHIAEIRRIEPSADGPARTLLRQILDPAKHGGEPFHDDLTAFADDPVFRSAVED
ncbi:hypothetical protein [Hansschlegelia plantiphila]|nr:hypothetical protein [Hansschlegelia plantiphila]